MVEKVARAMVAANPDLSPIEDWDEEDVALLMRQARAAIEAMREPTEFTLFAGNQNWSRGSYEMWRAMIDAALSENENGELTHS